MLIAKSSLVDLFFFCRQLVSTQLRGGLGVLVPSAWHDPQTGISFPSLITVMLLICMLHDGGLAWRSGIALVSINEVNLRRDRLVLGWVTMSRFSSRWGAFILVCNQPPRSTQPGHPFVDRRNEYQPKGGDAFRLGREVWFVCGWQVKLCDPLATHGSYLNDLEIKGLYIKRYKFIGLVYFLSLLY